MPKIDIKNLEVNYYLKNGNAAPITVFNGFSITFEDDSFNCLIGPSGCGKTTLLKTIIGFLDYSGTITVDGADYAMIPIPDKNIAYVSQNYSLYPNMTIFDNIAFPLRNKKADREEIIRRVNRIAEELGLTHCLARKPKDLSGGQQQRVALARALVKDPKLFIFDEPLSNVDPQLRAEERAIIRKTVKKHHATAIYVTHDFTEALALSDKLFVMEDGQIIISGTPDEVYNSGNALVENFKTATYENRIL